MLSPSSRPHSPFQPGQVDSGWSAARGNVKIHSGEQFKGKRTMKSEAFCTPDALVNETQMKLQENGRESGGGGGAVGRANGRRALALSPSTSLLPLASLSLAVGPRNGSESLTSLNLPARPPCWGKQPMRMVRKKKTLRKSRDQAALTKSVHGVGSCGEERREAPPLSASPATSAGDVNDCIAPRLTQGPVDLVLSTSTASIETATVASSTSRSTASSHESTGSFANAVEMPSSPSDIASAEVLASPAILRTACSVTTRLFDDDNSEDSEVVASREGLPQGLPVRSAVEQSAHLDDNTDSSECGCGTFPFHLPSHHHQQKQQQQQQQPPADTPNLSLLPSPISCLSPQMSSSAVCSPASRLPTDGGVDRLLPWTPAAPKHASIFYPAGLEKVAPVQMHYLQLGSWRTVAGGRDYFSHRRLEKGEVAGHTVRWLHNARPRDRFVFLVDPVEAVDAFSEEREGVAKRSHEKGVTKSVPVEDARAVATNGAAAPRTRGKSSRNGYPLQKAHRAAERWWDSVKERVFGRAPAFACSRGKLAKQAALSSSGCNIECELGEGTDRGAPVGFCATTAVDRLACAANRDPLGRPLLPRTPTSNCSSAPLPPLAMANAVSPTTALPPSMDAVGSCVGVPRYPYNTALPRAQSLSTLVQARRRSSHTQLGATYPFPLFTGSSPVVMAKADAPCSRKPVSMSKASVEFRKTGSGSQRRCHVEAVEICHSDVTALDYSPRLTSSRLSIEAKVVRTYVFDSLEDALLYYHCTEALALMRAQHLAGQSSHIPQARARKEQVKQHWRQGSSVAEDVAGSADEAERRKGSGAGTAEEDACDWQWAEKAGATSDGGASGAFFTKPAAMMAATDDESSRIASMASYSINAFHNAPAASFFCAAQHALASSQSHSLSEAPLCVTASMTSSHVSSSSAGATPRTMMLTTATTTVAATTTVGNGVDARTLQQQHHQEASAVASRTALEGIPAVQPRLSSSHFDTVVSVFTADPNFNAVLRELLMPDPADAHPYTASLASQRRMLALYETGMPPWSIFVASTILPYRRSLRMLYVGLMNVWPLVSLFVGVYDLYKHLPQLKKFLSHTLEPLTQWVDERVMVRVSFLLTYLFSVGLTTFASLSRFFSRFFAIQLFSLPFVRLLFQAIQMPFLVVFDTTWVCGTVLYSFARLLVVTVKVLIMGPFLLVAQLAGLFQVRSVAAIPGAAREGASLTLRWWRAWQEFWVTVASPIKNLAKAWCDSVIHICSSAARREATIRRWYAPKCQLLFDLLYEALDITFTNFGILLDMFWPEGYGHVVVIAAVGIYLYWLTFCVSQAMVRELTQALAAVLWQRWRRLATHENNSTTSSSSSSTSSSGVGGIAGNWLQQARPSRTASGEVPRWHLSVSTAQQVAAGCENESVWHGVDLPATVALLPAPLLATCATVISFLMRWYVGAAQAFASFRAGRTTSVQLTRGFRELSVTSNATNRATQHVNQSSVYDLFSMLFQRPATPVAKTYTAEQLQELQLSAVVEHPPTSLRPRWACEFLSYGSTTWLRYDTDELAHYERRCEEAKRANSDPILCSSEESRVTFPEPGSLRQPHRTAVLEMEFTQSRVGKKT